MSKNRPSDFYMGTMLIVIIVTFALFEMFCIYISDFYAYFFGYLWKSFVISVKFGYALFYALNFVFFFTIFKKLWDGMNE